MSAVQDIHITAQDSPLRDECGASRLAGIQFLFFFWSYHTNLYRISLWDMWLFLSCLSHKVSSVPKDLEMTHCQIFVVTFHESAADPHPHFHPLHLSLQVGPLMAFLLRIPLVLVASFATYYTEFHCGLPSHERAQLVLCWIPYLNDLRPRKSRVNAGIYLQMKNTQG